MNVVLAGLSHKTAPLALRERMVFAGAEAREILQALTGATDLYECALLSTCNRSEVYAVTRASAWQEQLLTFLAAQARLSPGQVQESLYCFEGTPAIRHLFRVASGLDSMVIGETQILAQVKETLQSAQDAGTSGTLIHSLLQHAISAGKRARSETEISRGAVSVSLAAIQLAKQIFGRLAGRSVLLLGAGENSEQTARLLLNEGVSRNLLVCNRTEARARALAEQIGGTVVPFENLAESLTRADIVISSTGAPEPILREETMQAAMRQRRGRPIFLIDIAVPRDISPEVADVADVFLYNIDDLQEVVERNLQVRQSEVERVEAIVEEETRRFQGWLRGREIAPTVAELKAHAESIVEAEVTRASASLDGLPEPQRAAAEELARRVAQKILQYPILHLRDAANSGNGYHEVSNVRAIFRLDREGAEEPEP